MIGECSRFHCEKFKSSDIWFLEPDKDFMDRKLKLGICPKCKNEVGELIETRKTDGKIFCNTVIKKDLTRLKLKEQFSIIYTAQKCNKNKFQKPYGWIYGFTSQRKKKRIVYACDFFRTREKIEEIS